MRRDILERKEDILKWIEEEQPKHFICKQLNCKQETLNSYLKKMNIEYAGQQNKHSHLNGKNNYVSAKQYLGTGKYISSFNLKEKLLREGLKQRECEICGLSQWMGYEIPLELHHKDGNHHNNDFDNLQILCPNCHAQQPGNSGSNKKRINLGD